MVVFILGDFFKRFFKIETWILELNGTGLIF